MSESLDKKSLIKGLRKFRDDFKSYKDICYELWKKQQAYELLDSDPLYDKEEKLREKLTEDWGRYEKLFQSLNAPQLTLVPSIGIPVHFFDEALSEKTFDNPHKYDGLRSSVSSATKAIGLLEAVSEVELRKLTEKPPSFFISFSFRAENESLIGKLKNFLESFPVSIITGAQPDTISVSEKVKNLIRGADYVIVVLTADDLQGDKSKAPSKWVQDEVAFSIGAGKKIIRLLEKEAIFKPAISGDAEYISFERENLTDAFIKLAHIINGLL